jgi:flavodoxin
MEGVMKTAVIYYSFEGNSDLIAKQLGQELKADVFKLETVDRKQRKGFAKYAWGGSMVVMHKKPPLKPFDIDAASYDLIIFGFPVWAAAPAPPLNTFLSQVKITGKKIALFCCHAGGKGAALDKLKAQLPGNEFVGEIDFLNPAQQEEAVIADKVKEWAKTL